MLDTQHRGKNKLIQGLTVPGLFNHLIATFVTLVCKFVYKSKVVGLQEVILFFVVSINWVVYPYFSVVI